jgi:hypothetical protein
MEYANFTDNRANCRYMTTPPPIPPPTPKTPLKPPRKTRDPPQQYQRQAQAEKRA